MANDVFTFTEEGKEYKIVMYSGLTNKLTTVLGGIEGVDSLLIDAEKQEEVIKLLLTKYKDDGSSDGYLFPPFKLNNENRKSLIVWGFENVTDFLLDIIGKSTSQVEKVKEFVKSTNVG